MLQMYTGIFDFRMYYVGILGGFYMIINIQLAMVNWVILAKQMKYTLFTLMANSNLDKMYYEL